VTADGLPRIFSVPEPAPDLMPEPAAAPVLSLVPEPGGTGSGGTTEPAGGSGAVVPGTGSGGTSAALVQAFTVPAQRISFAANLALTLRMRAAIIAADQKRHRTFWHWIWVAAWETPPETLEAHRAHLKSRQWVQEYMTGRVRWLIIHENIVYGILIARSVKFFCQTVDKVFERQSRFWIAVAVIAFGLLIRFASHL
jgi:hypothetical protein